MIAILLLLAQLFPFPGGTPAFPTLVSSAGGATNGSFGSGTASLREAQSFTLAANSHIMSVDVKLYKTLSPTDQVFVDLYTSTVTPTPDTLIATTTTTLMGTDLTTTATAYTFQFSNVAVSSGKAWIVMRRSGAFNNANYYQTVFGTNVYSGGGRSVYNSVTPAWSTEVANQDIYFVVKGTQP